MVNCARDIDPYQGRIMFHVMDFVKSRDGMFSISFLGADKWTSLPVSCRHVEHLSACFAL